jgi:hypothetical protein
VRHCLPWLGIVLVLGACDLKPAPKKQPQPAVATTATAPAPGAAAPAPPLPPAAPPPGAPTPGQAPASPAVVTPAVPAGDLELAQGCMQVAVRVANLIVSTAPDAVLKAQYEQERANMVRAVAEGCTRSKWEPDLRQCFLAASTREQLDACNARAPGSPDRPSRSVPR